MRRYTAIPRFLAMQRGKFNPSKVNTMAGNASRKSARVAKPALLAGGNPKISKADGDAPVQAYIAAMPGWKRAVGRHLDAVILRTLPDVSKGVRWNSHF